MRDEALSIAVSEGTATHFAIFHAGFQLLGKKLDESETESVEGEPANKHFTKVFKTDQFRFCSWKLYFDEGGGGLHTNAVVIVAVRVGKNPDGSERTIQCLPEMLCTPERLIECHGAENLSHVLRR